MSGLECPDKLVSLTTVITMTRKHEPGRMGMRLSLSYREMESSKAASLPPSYFPSCLQRCCWTHSETTTDRYTTSCALTGTVQPDKVPGSPKLRVYSSELNFAGRDMLSGCQSRMYFSMDNRSRGNMRKEGKGTRTT